MRRYQVLFSGRRCGKVFRGAMLAIDRFAQSLGRSAA